MSAAGPIAVPENPRLRSEVSLRRLASGSVHIAGPGIDAFIVDDGTATVLEACDGRPLQEVSADLDARFGWGMSVEDIRGLLERWAERGYLDGTPARSSRLLRLDPSGLLGLLHPLTRLYGNRVVAVLAGLLVLAGAVLTVLEGPALLDALSGMVRWSPPLGAAGVIAGYYLGYSVTAFFHELGHALAIRRFDGEVPEIGVQRNTNFYVLSDREVLQAPSDRVWYYGGGLLSDSVWWVGAWVWWLAAPGPVPLLLLVPQCVYFLVFAWAPTGASDMALMLREVTGWRLIPRARSGSGWRSAWASAPRPQVAMDVLRYLVAAALVVAVARHDVLLLVLYAVYRFGRKALNRL